MIMTGYYDNEYFTTKLTSKQMLNGVQEQRAHHKIRVKFGRTVEEKKNCVQS